MARVDLPPARLTIARDSDKVIVAWDPPIVYGDARRTTTGSITEIVAVPRQVWTSCHAFHWAPSAVSESAPGTAPGSIGLLLGFIAALLTTLAVSRVASAWVGVPLGVTIVVAVAAAAFVQSNRADRRWRERHVVLTDPYDREALNRGGAAAQQIADVWPSLGGLADVADATPTLATALWELALVLAHRQTVRDARDDLAGAWAAVSPDNPVWGEVAVRREQADAELAGLDREAGRHLAHLTGLAEECARFRREQEAVKMARLAVVHADRVLGRTAAVTLEGAGAALADRTRAVLAAYRELTSHLGVAVI